MNGYIRHAYSRMRIVHYNGQRFEVWYGLGGKRDRQGRPKPWTMTVEWLVEFNGSHRTTFKSC